MMKNLLALAPLFLVCCADPSLLPSPPPPMTTTPIGEPSAPAAAEAPWSYTEITAWGAGQGDGALELRALPTPPSSDYHLQVELRVDQAAVEDDPVHQLSAFAYYNNNTDLGGYEAVLVLRQEGEQHYRLMVSAHYNEVLLWSSRGGMLQVKPFPFTEGRAYTLHASVIGGRVTLSVDDKPLIDYSDRVAPLPRGGAALGRMNGSVTLGKAVLWTASASERAPQAMAAPHTPRLAMRKWKGMTWAFDGDEPIFALGLPPNYRNAFAPRTYECTGFEIKLVPGYVPQLYLPWYIQNWNSETFTPANLEELKVLEEGARLQFNLRCTDPVDRPDLISQARVTVDYDAASNVYRYDTQTTLTVPPGATLAANGPMDFVDPGLYNGVQSGSPQGKTWVEPHPNSVYMTETGEVHRQPHNHMDWYPGYGLEAWFNARKHYMNKDRGFWAEVGDPVANPIFQMLTAPPGGAVLSQMCWWAYDLHLSWEPPTPTLGPGDYSMRWRMSALGGGAGDALLNGASYALPTDLSATWLLYTGGIGHTERFDKVVKKASSFGEFPWGEGALQDPRVGHGDSTSLRFSGPGYAQSSAGESRFGENFLPGTDYEISVWVKTQGVVGQGPGLYFGDRSHYPGIRGTSDWQRVSIVVRPAGDLNVQTFGLHNAGAGTVWFDDFLIRPITADRPADPASVRMLTSITQVNRDQPPQAGMTLSWTAASESADGTLLDQSGWGNHGALLGARWVNESEGGQTTRVLEMPGGGAQALLPGYPALNLGEKATVSVWFKPGQNLDSVMTLLAGGIESTDLWRVLLQGERAPWQLTLQVPGGNVSTSSLIAEGRWFHLAITHNGSQVVGYVNGVKAAQGPARGRWLGLGAEGYLRMGSGRYESNFMAPLAARAAKLQVYSRVLSTAEIKALSSAGIF